MAILTPNYLQTKSYSAKRDRRVQQAEVMQEGIVDFGHYAVVQRGAGANMSVDVAAGEAWVDGDAAADQGFYHVVNDAVVNVAITTASPANPRIDAVVLAVNDSTEIGGSDEFKLEAIAGTPTSGATLANLKGAPTPGPTKLLLAYVLVGTSVTSITTEKIGAKRDYRAGLTGYPAAAEPTAVTGAPAQYAHGRPISYVPAVRAIRATVTTANNGEITVAFNGADTWENDGIMHNNAGTETEQQRFKALTPGFYLVTWRAFSATSAITLSSRLARVTNEGTSAEFFNTQSGVSHGASTTYNTGTSGSVVMRLGFGESASLRLGTSLNVFADCDLSMVWQGP